MNSAASKPMFKDGQAAAQALGVNLQLMEIKFPDPDLEGAFRAMAKQRIGALITGSGNLGSSLHRKTILALVEQARMPAIYATEPWIEAGGLMYYGVEYRRLKPARRSLRGQNSQRREARRLTGRATHEVRFRDQSESREANRVNNSS